MYFKVTKENDDRSFQQMNNIEELEERGMPVTIESEAKNFCIPDPQQPEHLNGDINPLKYLPWTGMNYHAHCVSNP